MNKRTEESDILMRVRDVSWSLHPASARRHNPTSDILFCPAFVSEKIKQRRMNLNDLGEERQQNEQPQKAKVFSREPHPASTRAAIPSSENFASPDCMSASRSKDDEVSQCFFPFFEGTREERGMQLTAQCEQGEISATSHFGKRNQAGVRQTRQICKCKRKEVFPQADATDVIQRKNVDALHRYNSIRLSPHPALAKACTALSVNLPMSPR